MVLGTFSIGCTEQTSINNHQLRDSLAVKYLEISDTYFPEDTVKTDIIFWKSYLNNDTATLKSIVDNTNQWLAYEKSRFDTNSYIYLHKLPSAAYSVIYHFKYSEAFYDHTLEFAIGKYAGRDSAVIIRKIDLEDDKIRNKTRIKTQVYDTFYINLLEWEKFEALVFFADFWNSKTLSYEGGWYHGAILDVYGYTNKRHNYISHKDPDKKAIWLPFQEALKITKANLDYSRFLGTKYQLSNISQ